MKVSNSSIQVGNFSSFTPASCYSSLVDVFKRYTQVLLKNLFGPLNTHSYQLLNRKGGSFLLLVFVLGGVAIAYYARKKPQTPPSSSSDPNPAKIKKIKISAELEFAIEESRVEIAYIHERGNGYHLEINCNLASTDLEMKIINGRQIIAPARANVIIKDKHIYIDEEKVFFFNRYSVINVIDGAYSLNGENITGGDSCIRALVADVTCNPRQDDLFNRVVVLVPIDEEKIASAGIVGYMAFTSEGDSFLGFTKSQPSSFRFLRGIFPWFRELFLR